MRLKLFPKVALILILLATLPVVIVGWQTATLNREHIESTVLDLHTNLARSLSTRIELHLNNVVGKVSALVESLRIQGINSVDVFQPFLDSNIEFVSISYLKDGNEMIKSTNFAYPKEIKKIDRTGSPVFEKFVKQKSVGGIYQFNHGFSFQDGDPQLTLVFPFNPVSLDGGAIYIVVSLSSLWTDIREEGGGTGGGGGRDALVVDDQGFIIAHSNDEVMQKIIKWGKRHIDASKNPIVQEALNSLSIGSKEYTDTDGVHYVGSYHNVEGMKWVSIIQEPQENAYLAVYQTRKTAIQFVLISLLVAAIVAFLFAKNLSKPIFALIDGARKITKGDFTHTVEIKSKDEMGDLASTFNEMTKELKRYSELQIDRILEEKTKTESIIYSIADGIILTDGNGVIQLLNTRAVNIFSLHSKPDEKGELKLEGEPQHPEEKLIGQNLNQLISDDKLKTDLQELLSKPDTKLKKEVMIQEKSYMQHYQLSSQRVLTPKTGKNVGVVTVIHDVTLEKEVDELKERFLHSITHDLRNPMTSIMGFTRFILDETSGPVNENQKRMLLTIERAGTRLLGMINDILDSAKIEAGKMETDIMSIDMAAVADNTKILYEPLAQKKRVKLNVQMPEVSGEQLKLQGDENLVERVIGNLVANAIKFTPPNGEITIQMESFSDKIQVSVTDSGPGIPADYRDKIFDKFQQVKGEKRSGTGLGLTICKYFVEQHRGKIWIDPKSDKGARFVFWIPRNLVKNKDGHLEISKT